jgi:hypothetical protein
MTMDWRTVVATLISAVIGGLVAGGFTVLTNYQLHRLELRKKSLEQRRDRMNSRFDRVRQYLAHSFDWVDRLAFLYNLSQAPDDAVTSLDKEYFQRLALGSEETAIPFPGRGSGLFLYVRDETVRGDLEDFNDILWTLQEEERRTLIQGQTGPNTKENIIEKRAQLTRIATEISARLDELLDANN